MPNGPRQPPRWYITLSPDRIRDERVDTKTIEVMILAVANIILYFLLSNTRNAARSGDIIISMGI
ncbi:MAG: hypothetical protein DRH33_04715 [Candidatus Nealsonbacteria bacterium]|nr:MAG: hypothetical protein DRH33_04715 [Candidatus Nealsonbacteria bacterium]